MTTSKSLKTYGVAAAALCAAAAGGYVARAGGVADGAVNARPAPSAAVGAPVSFADIVQRVAPAVVSIEVEGKIGPHPIADQFGGGEGDGDDDSGGLPPELRRF
ncbi:MAG TPA: hypothetical protein VGN89_14755, partial [Phenylobacterium sp.]|nr:hypothetical protein [Phenylobacterium sp.]